MTSENQIGIVSKHQSSQHERAWQFEKAGWPPATARQMAQEGKAVKEAAKNGLDE